MMTPNEHDDIQRTAPLLHGIPKLDPFVESEDFFEHFPHQVQAAIHANEKKPFSSRLWLRRLAFALPVIALVMAGTWWALRTDSTPDSSTFSAETLPNDPSVIDDLDDADLLAYLDEVGDAPNDMGTVDVELSAPELLAYLEDSGTDLNELVTGTE